MADSNARRWTQVLTNLHYLLVLMDNQHAEEQISACDCIGQGVYRLTATICLTSFACIRV